MEINTGDADDFLTIEEKKELSVISGGLKGKAGMPEKNKPLVINDWSAKKKLAEFLLKLAKKVLKGDDLRLQNTCYLIAGFMFYDFGDELDDVLGLAGVLELPRHHVDGNPEVLFDKLKNDLESYIKKA